MRSHSLAFQQSEEVSSKLSGFPFEISKLSRISNLETEILNSCTGGNWKPESLPHTHWAHLCRLGVDSQIHSQALQLGEGAARPMGVPGEQQVRRFPPRCVPFRFVQLSRKQLAS